jgi:enoyl-CoA hydratase/carnithine racemase
MAYATFLVERSGPVATVAFNRPESLNPVNATVLRELLAIAGELAEDDTTRAVVLTGQGRAFCAGADTKAVLEGLADRDAQRRVPEGARLRLSRQGRRVMDEWERLDQVTIAAINGWAVGGGLSLAMACDFRLMAEDARIFIPEVRLGLPYLWGSLTRLINLVGPARAKELVMTCEEIGAAEALAMGLVNRVVLAMPPMAIRRTKEVFRALSTNRLGDVTAFDAYLGAGCATGEDLAEAIAAFRQKRPGRYHDR